MPLVEHTCEVCRRGFVRKTFDGAKRPQFCSHSCAGLSRRTAGNYLEKRREIQLRAKRKARAKDASESHANAVR